MSLTLLTDATTCADCKACGKDAAYQTPPALFAGTPKAPILVLGQAPLEISSDDEHRLDWAKLFTQMDPGILGAGMAAWNLWDVYNSRPYRILSLLFGSDWLTSGQYIWSNAVKCRIPGDETPNENMISACGVWTKMVTVERRAIIMLGEVARQQVLGLKAKSLAWGIPRKHSAFGYLLALPGLVLDWTEDETESYVMSVETIARSI